ncbi:MAG: O-antigen ligase family protein [Candidatus Doudnabacteria bacterium]
MKLTSEKILKTLLFLLIFSLPFQKRHIFFDLSPTLNGQFSEYLAISLYISDIFLAITLLWFIFANKISKNLSKYWVFGLIALNTLFSLLVISPRGTNDWYLAAKTLESLILAIFALNVSREATYRRFISLSLVVTGVFQSLVALGQFLVQHTLGLRIFGEQVIGMYIDGVAKIDLDGEKFIRAYGTFAHPNQLSAFLIVTCATAIYLFVQENKNKQKIFYGFALVIMIVGNYLTFSRSGLLALYISIALIVILLIKKTKLEYKKLLAIILTTTIVAIAILHPFLNARTNTAPTIFNRTLYNTAGLKIFSEHPIFGVGIGNMIPEMSKQLNFTESWQVQPPHNFFLEVACETGILGVILIILLFASVLKKGIQQIKKTDGEQLIYNIVLASAFIAIIFLMFFDHYFYTLQQTQLLLWLLIGMILGQTTD